MVAMVGLLLSGFDHGKQGHIIHDFTHEAPTKAGVPEFVECWGTGDDAIRAIVPGTVTVLIAFALLVLRRLRSSGVW